ncbi:MAG TPA: hypothetical protein VNM92_12570 [Thermoanaerobaculia bacterium]|nr:hypothetical protein [Thermoanaerobaculia bacterium]
MTYREWVEDTAASLGSDGCTGVGAMYRFCCLEHDIFWRTGVMRDGTPITEAEANARFRSCIQRHSPFGWWSPLAWIRWLGVRFGGLHPSVNRDQGSGIGDRGSRRGYSNERPEEARRRIIAEVERAR